MENIEVLQEVINNIASSCERLEIADRDQIKIVAVPKMENRKDLFGNVTAARSPKFVNALSKAGKLSGNPEKSDYFKIYTAGKVIEFIVSTHSRFNSTVVRYAPRVKKNIEAETNNSGSEIIAQIENTVIFKPHSIVSVDKYTYSYKSSISNPEKEKNLLSQFGNSNAYNGYLSPATTREIKKRLDVWLTSIDVSCNLAAGQKSVDQSSVYPTFVTLTLPSKQIHTDYDIKKYCLDPFLSWAKGTCEQIYKTGKNKGKQKSFGVEVFFWRAEIHPHKTGDIHFHVLMDRFVPWERIREKWNELVENLGYITRFANTQKAFFRNGFRINESSLEKELDKLKGISDKARETNSLPPNCPSYFAEYLEIAIKYKKPLSQEAIRDIAVKQQEENYKKGTECDWTNPNSTDIHGIHNLKSVTAYVVKYVTKKAPIKKIDPTKQVLKTKSDGIEYIYDLEEHYDPRDGSPDHFEINERVYQPEFLERKIQGNLWGCSKALKPQNKVEKPEYELKYFQKVLYGQIITRSEWSFKKESKISRSDAFDLCETTNTYLINLRNAIGDTEIDRLSGSVGESFSKMNGEIIPLMTDKLGYKRDKKNKPAVVKHQEIMRKYSPQLADEYESYYRNIFSKIYKTAS